MRAHLLVHPLRCALASVPVDKIAAHFEAFARAEARVLPKKAPRRSRKAVILVIVDVKMLPASGASRYYFSTTATKAKFPSSTTTDGFMYAPSGSTNAAARVRSETMSGFRLTKAAASFSENFRSQD